MNEWEIQVMYLIITGTALSLVFALLEGCQHAFFYLRRQWRNRR